MGKFIVAVAAIYLLLRWGSGQIDFEKSLEYAKKNSGETWSPTVEYSLGMIAFQRSDYPKAQAAFAQMLTDHPTCQYQAKGLLRLAKSAEETASWDVAKDAYRKYIEAFPGGKDVEIAKNRLEFLNYKH